jgi:hypothetical protein
MIHFIISELVSQENPFLHSMTFAWRSWLARRLYNGAIATLKSAKVLGSNPGVNNFCSGHPHRHTYVLWNLNIH